MCDGVCLAWCCVGQAVAPSKLSEIAGRGSEKENEIKALVAAAVAKSTTSKGGMQESDCDEQVFNYLKVLPMEVVKQSIVDFCELDANDGLDNVKNRSSFFMGLIKQRDAGFINDDLTLPHFAEKAAKKAKFAATTQDDGDEKGQKNEGGVLVKEQEESMTIMVKGLPFSATAADIAAHFASCCESGSSSDMDVRIVMVCTLQTISRAYTRDRWSTVCQLFQRSNYENGVWARGGRRIRQQSSQKALHSLTSRRSMNAPRLRPCTNPRSLQRPMAQNGPSMSV